MVIKKEYNIEQLAEQLQNEIENSKKYNRVVKLDILTANDILDVLNETNKRTKSRDVDKEVSEQNCFGMYDDDDIECQCCDSKKECKKRKERLDCFGCHIDGNGKCNLCVYEKECVNETKERERCFGKSYGKRPIIICGTCKYAKRCEVLTKHE